MPPARAAAASRQRRGERKAAMAALCGAAGVMAVESSAGALEVARENAELNGVSGRITFERADVSKHLRKLRQEGRRFGCVILDPPAFARKEADIERALSAYGRLTRLGLGVLRRGGTLVQASCSSRVSAEAFFATVNEAAVRQGRPLRELERTGHALDHPVSFREGAYLKCLFAVAP